jgi:glycosyltransferase involved in cell wall biosynthesis
MNILIVSYWFPPVNVVGVYRPFHWAKYLARKGHSVTVLTSKKTILDGPLDFFPLMESNINVVEVEYRRSVESNGDSSPITLSADRKSFFKQVKGYIGPIADQRIGWYFKSKRIVNELCQTKKIDFIISSFDPPASLFVAKYAANKFDIPWLSDYRDLWSENHINKPFFIFDWLQKVVERRFFSSSVSIATTISKGLESDLAKVYPGKTTVIPNGYDPEDYLSISPSNLLNTNKINLVYAGSLYKGYRDPTPLIKGLGRMDNNVDFNIFGVGRGQLDFVEKETVLNCVKLHGYQKKSEVLSAIQSADFAVIVESPNPDAAGVMTGKVFELVAMRKPIISVGIVNTSELYKFLKKTGLLVLEADDPEVVSDFFERYLSNPILELDIDEEFIGLFNREHQVTYLESIIENYKKGSKVK